MVAKGDVFPSPTSAPRFLVALGLILKDGLVLSAGVFDRIGTIVIADIA